MLNYHPPLFDDIIFSHKLATLMCFCLVAILAKAKISRTSLCQRLFSLNLRRLLCLACDQIWLKISFQKETSLQASRLRQFETTTARVWHCDSPTTRNIKNYFPFMDFIQNFGNDKIWKTCLPATILGASEVHSKVDSEFKLACSCLIFISTPVHDITYMR